MELKELMKRAAEIKEKYHTIERRNIGREWNRLNIMEGFVVDIGELMEIIMAKEGLRSDVKDIDERLKRELSDCFYSILVLASKYNIDLEETFVESMDILEKRIEKM